MKRMKLPSSGGAARPRAATPTPPSVRSSAHAANHYELARSLAYATVEEPSHPLIAALLLCSHYACVLWVEGLGRGGWGATVMRWP